MTEFLRCSRAYRLFESASVGSSLWAPRKKNFVRPGKKRSKPCQIYGPSYSIPTRIGLLVRCNPVSGSDARRNSCLHRKKILQRRTLSALFFGTSGFPPFHVDALWSKTKGKKQNARDRPRFLISIEVTWLIFVDLTGYIFFLWVVVGFDWVEPSFTAFIELNRLLCQMRSPLPDQTATARSGDLLNTLTGEPAFIGRSIWFNRRNIRFAGVYLMSLRGFTEFPWFYGLFMTVIAPSMTRNSRFCFHFHYPDWFVRGSSWVWFSPATIFLIVRDLTRFFLGVLDFSL